MIERFKAWSFELVLWDGMQEICAQPQVSSHYHLLSTVADVTLGASVHWLGALGGGTAAVHGSMNSITTGCGAFSIPGRGGIFDQFMGSVPTQNIEKC